MKHNHCCVNNIPRGFLNFAELAATVRGNTVSVNFFSPFDAVATLPDGGKVKLSVSGNYPADGPVRIAWEASLSGPALLRIRIPGWATDAALESGAPARKTAGGWFELPLGPGKAEAILTLGRKVEVREHPAPAEVPEWYRTRWNEPGMEELFRTGRGSTLIYGPLLLARSKQLGNSEEEMFGPPLPPGFECGLRPQESAAAGCAYEAEFRTNDKVFRTKVCDYASAGNEISEDRKRFSVFF